MKKILTMVAALALGAAALTVSSSNDSSSEAPNASAITLQEPVVRALAEMSMKSEATGKYMTASFMTISNSSDEDITLTGGSSDVAGIIEIHEVINGEMVQMADGLVVPAKGSVKLRMGSYHVMMLELNKELKAGDEATITLNFSDGEKITYTAPVKMIAMDDEVYGKAVM